MPIGRGMMEPGSFASAASMSTRVDMDAALAKDPGSIMPLPIGIFRNDRLPSLEERLEGRITEAKTKKGEGDLRKLLFAGDMWEVK